MTLNLLTTKTTQKLKKLDLDELWKIASELGAVRVWQNSYNGMISVTIKFGIVNSEIEAKGAESSSVLEAFESAIDTATNLGAMRPEARNRLK